MAAIHERNGNFRVMFRYRGKQRNFTLGRVSEAEAKAKADQVEYLLMRLDQGLIALPPGADVVTFVRHDGVVLASGGQTKQDSPTLAALRDRYLETHGDGTLEAHTLQGVRRHFKHLARELGEAFPIRELSLADLQGYVDKRAKAKGRRGPLNPATIKKEVVTLRTAWNWGVRMKIVAGRYLYDGLRYPKGEEASRFMTRAEIERLPRAARSPLWRSLYLTLPEIESLLAFVAEKGAHPWIHPLVATAAHTGARKGELLRMLVSDVDFDAGVVTITERKRVHDRTTTRRVPLSSDLSGVLKGWLAVHPGGPHLFAQAEEVERSKKRSRTTGHRSKDRPGSLKERRATVRERERPGVSPVTENECHHHFRQALKGGEWEVVKGLHALRHSFISACAGKGVDQRFIDEWAGHQSEAMKRRYRHLAPSVQAEALKGVFG